MPKDETLSTKICHDLILCEDTHLYFGDPSALGTIRLRKEGAMLIMERKDGTAACGIWRRAVW